MFRESTRIRLQNDGRGNILPNPSDAHTPFSMAMTLAYLAVALVGFVILGGATLLFFKVFSIPALGPLLLPAKLMLLLVLGFCVAHTLNDLLARSTDVDLRDRLEKRLDR